VSYCTFFVVTSVLQSTPFQMLADNNTLPSGTFRNNKPFVLTNIEMVFDEQFTCYRWVQHAEVAHVS